MKTYIEIGSWIVGCEGAEISLAFLELAGTYNDETINIISANDCKLLLTQLWPERCFSIYTVTPPDILSAYAKINSLYTMWKTQQLPDLLRAFYTLQLEYEPLDNYNGYEKTEVTYGKTDTTTYGKTDTIHHGKTNTLSTDIYGYNSTDASNSDKVTSEDTGTTATEYRGDDKIEASGKDTTEITKRGNLGLTSSQQMVLSEWDLRRKNFVIDALRDFVNTFTIYIGG